MAYYDNIFGIGKGDAQVLQGNVGITALRQQYAQDQARRAAEDKEMTAEMAKVNYDGARTEDIEHLTNKYADLRASASKISSLPIRERASAKADFDGKKRLFMADVAQSKTEGQTLADFGKDIFANRDNYADDAYDRYKSLKGTSTFDAKYRDNAESFVTNAKANKFNSDKLLGEIEPNAVEEIQGGVQSRRIAGGTMNYRLEGKQVNKDKLFKSIDAQLTASPAHRRGIKDMFPDAKDPIEAVEKYKEYAYGLLNGKHKLQEKTINTQMDQRLSPEFIYRRDHGLLGGQKSEGEKTAVYRQDLVNNIFDETPGSGEKLAALVKGKGQFDGTLQVVKGYSSPNKFGIKIPTRKYSFVDGEGNERVKTIEGRTVIFDKSNPNDKITLNEIINEVSGEKVNLSQLMTTGGKKKVEGGKGVSNLKQAGANTQAKPSAKKEMGGYKIGQAVSGYKYLGGDPADQNNWSKK